MLQQSSMLFLRNLNNNNNNNITKNIIASKRLLYRILKQSSSSLSLSSSYNNSNNIINNKISNSNTNTSITKSIQLGGGNNIKLSNGITTLPKINNNKALNRNYVTSSTTDNSKNESSSTTKTIVVESDIFGEPITYIVNDNNNGNNSKVKGLINESSIQWDEYILSITTRGKSSSSKSNCNAMGISIQSSHSFAIIWSKLISTILELKYSNVHSPMLVIGCILPTLCIGGYQYLKYIDEKLLYRHIRNKDVSLLSLMNEIISRYDDDNLVLTKREQYYIQCIKHLLNSNHEKALHALIDILTIAPGDVFALSQIMDMSSTVGNTIIPLRASGTVASYLTERSNTLSTISSLGLSYVSLGYAVGKRYKEAEIYATLATTNNKGDKSLCTPIIALSLATLYDTEGRIEEGISLLYNYDGVHEYNTCSGYYFYDSILSSYSITLFLLQRDNKHKKTISNCLRIYNDYFTRIFDCSGINNNYQDNDTNNNTSSKEVKKWVQPLIDLPVPRYRELYNESASSLFSFLPSFFNNNDTKQQDKITTTSEEIPTSAKEIVNNNHDVTTTPKQHKEKNVLSKDDLENKLTHILTYLPPTPQILSHATIILLYITLSNYNNNTNPSNTNEENSTEKDDAKNHNNDETTKVTSINDLWSDLHIAWKNLYFIYNDNNNNNNSMSFCPLAKLLSSIFIDPTTITSSSTTTTNHDNDKLEETFFAIGKVLNIPQYTIQYDDNNNNVSLIPIENNKLQYTKEEEQQLWNTIIDNLYQYYYLQQQHKHNIWDVQIASLLDFLLYNSMLQNILQQKQQNNDLQDDNVNENTNLLLYKARAICSEQIVLKPNNTEYWWRYSYVLNLLNDDMASQRAMDICRNLVGSSGSTRSLSHFHKDNENGDDSIDYYYKKDHEKK